MVTLILPYHNGDTQPTSSSTTTPDTSDMHLGNLVTKLTRTILRTRIGSDSYRCERNHQTASGYSQCFLTDPLLANMDGTSEWELVLCIVHKHRLLERWIIQYSPSPTTTNNSNKPSPSAPIILLLQSVYSHTRLLPVESLLNRLLLKKSDLDFVLTTTDTVHPSLGCHSSFANGSQPTDFDTINDFPFASVATHSFSAVDCVDIEGQLSVQVMYDQVIDKVLLTTEPTQVLSVFPPPAIGDDGVVVPEYKQKSTVGLYDKTSAPMETGSTTQLQVPLPISPNPRIGMRRLSRLSLSALDDEDNSSSSEHLQQQQDDHNPALVMPISTTSPIQYTHHGHALAYSTSPSANYQHTRRLSISYQQPLHHRLVGSYEESLLSGRMSTLQPSKPIYFQAQIGVHGEGRVKPSLKWPPQRTVLFPAYFYNGQENSNDDLFGTTPASVPSAPPYVGTIDLTVDADGGPSKGYRVPSQGQLQIIIKNPLHSLVKHFLVPYDVSKMPRGTKTFLRQKTYAHLRSRSTSSSTPKYIIHLQLCRTEKNRVFLYNKMRVVFVNRCLNHREPFEVVCDGPKEPIYSPL